MPKRNMKAIDPSNRWCCRCAIQTNIYKRTKPYMFSNRPNMCHTYNPFWRRSNPNHNLPVDKIIIKSSLDFDAASGSPINRWCFAKPLQAEK